MSEQKALIPLDGKLITGVDSGAIGKNFATLKNMRYSDGHPKSIGGMTKINTSALTTYLKIRNGIHYVKDQPSENHLLVQAYNTGLTASKVYQNTTAIPSQGNFSGTELWSDSTGAGLGRFSKAPNGEIAYCNGVDTCIYGGDEIPVGRFINYDPSGNFEYDYTDQVKNTLQDSKNVATVVGAGGGIDSNAMIILSLNNNVTDSSPTTPHTVTNNNVTFSTTTKVFGTHAAVFNRTTASLTIPDNDDLDFSGGTWTIDGRFRFDNLTSNRILFYQYTTVLKVAFTSGSEEPSVDDVVVGATGEATGIVDYVGLDTGTFAGGDAAGTLYIHTQTGTFEAENLNISGGTENVMSIGGNTSAAGTNYIKLYAGSAILKKVYLVVYECYGSGSIVVELGSSRNTINSDTWYHIEVVENSNDWYIFVDGALKGYLSDASRAKNYISTAYIGTDTSTYHKG